jgi:hypothetical protein
MAHLDLLTYGTVRSNLTPSSLMRKARTYLKEDHKLSEVQIAFLAGECVRDALSIGPQEGLLESALLAPEYGDRIRRANALAGGSPLEPLSVVGGVTSGVCGAAAAATLAYKAGKGGKAMIASAVVGGVVGSGLWAWGVGAWSRMWRFQLPKK